MGESILSVLQEAIKAGKPVALATVIEGHEVGRKMVLGPNIEVHGTLGNESLDRVVLRDMSGELEAGRTGTRHYGLNGEAREEELTVFIFTLIKKTIKSLSKGINLYETGNTHKECSDCE